MDAGGSTSTRLITNVILLANTIKILENLVGKLLLFTNTPWHLNGSRGKQNHSWITCCDLNELLDCRNRFPI